MPTLIMFGPPPPPGDPSHPMTRASFGPQRDGIVVEEEPTDVASQLQRNGWAKLSLQTGGEPEPVWVNAAAVRFVRGNP